MADITLPKRVQDAGIPYQWSQEIDPQDRDSLFSGSEPAVLTMDLVAAASQTIPALTPVGRNGAGALVPAVSGTTAAIGITITDVVTAAASTKGIPVYRAGCFNPDKLNWPESYDTDAKKFAAFEGAPTPTNIVIRRPKFATV